MFIGDASLSGSKASTPVMQQLYGITLMRPERKSVYLPTTLPACPLSIFVWDTVQLAR